jgi:hypothetical protein
VQDIKTFLQSPTTPATLVGAIVTLETRVQDMRTALTQLEAGITAFATNTSNPAW